MSEKVSEKITIDRKDIEDAIKYLEGTAKNIFHVNHALFDPSYKSKLDWNNEHDLRYIKMTLFMAVASINREITELEKKLKEE
jgi:hypothetical protein